MFTSYEDTVAYLFNRFPDFQNNGGSAYKPGLERVFQLCELLDNPQEKIKTIHVAGTNGKGSVCSTLASVYQEGGYKVGLYISPHMIDFRERIRVNGEMISKTEVVDFVNKYLEPFQEIDPSFFEWSTVLAFYYFAKNKVDIAIIETGLGGRLDATNVITPEVSVITSIGIDHIGYLGNTIGQIAGEKAGIIKEGVPVVIGNLDKESREVFDQVAENKHSTVIEAKEFIGYRSSLIGDHQYKNKDLALTVIDVIKNEFPVDNTAIEKGLSNISKNAGLRGRYEALEQEPKIVADIAHNEQAMKALIDALGKENYRKLHIVIGMVDDKEVEKVIGLLPPAVVYCCKPDNKRGLNENKLKEIVVQKGKFEVVEAFPSCREAFIAAKSNMENADLLLVTGSNFVVSEIIGDFY